MVYTWAFKSYHIRILGFMYIPYSYMEPLGPGGQIKEVASVVETVAAAVSQLKPLAKSP